MARFDKLAKRYNKARGIKERKASQFKVLLRLAKPKKSWRVLDVGGGTGIIAGLMAPLVKQVVVADPSEKMLGFAPKDATKNVKTVRASAQRLPFKPGSFDLVYCTDSLHHFPEETGKLRETGSAIKGMLRVLKKGGKLVIIDMDPASWRVKLLIVFENWILGNKCIFVGPGKLEALLSGQGRTRAEGLGKGEYALVMEKTD